MGTDPFRHLPHQPIEALSTYPDSVKALKHFHALETLRLEACIGRELPGLYREMQRLKTETGVSLPAGWEHYAADSPTRSHVADSLRLLDGSIPSNARCCLLPG